MRSSSAVYVIVAAGFVAAVVLAFSDLSRAAGALLFTVGVAAITFARPLTLTQNQIDRVTDRVIPNPWGTARPQLFIIWGIGMGLLGLALLLRLL